MQPISIILLALSANLALASVLTPPGLEKRLGCIWTNCCGEGIKGRHCLGDYQECPKGTQWIVATPPAQQLIAKQTSRFASVAGGMAEEKTREVKVARRRAGSDVPLEEINCGRSGALMLKRGALYE
ncbi:uncharacterized protein MYCGRDRAFT_95712 [Zymoseptoria tritici IPO323]|uniref:Uncharacterized protein n=1 Tax=Zymoseptoria tritici (strain CBS 115943 / IPO323) TaxID=336722 RepID=F9XK73_ZYMTI|nr:uncharacterized protein MYCGRDRAFT_95712 [Zymoseptoria tritici IPO323]EGP84367.1 hypothetical protein MYCGRDRAFT_95712 [Zymoseptoria tritici IPO323]